jgi:RHS repeat-associated protein
MPLASTWLDLVIGADVHIEMVPTPGGPVPTPFPHPFVGLVGDPGGAVVDQFQSSLMSLAMGGSLAPPNGKVLINGLTATTTSMVAKNAPALLHVPLPPGSAFQRAPPGDAKLPLGSLTVTFGGANAVRGGDQAASCSDPARLLTSSVAALPKGPPVEIGGPPGIRPASAAGEKVSGAPVRTVWGAASALFRYAGRLNPTRLRNLIPNAKCFFTGHPVDVATGRVMTWTIDFTLPGAIPLVFGRDYASSWASRSGPLGPGWSHTVDRAVWEEPGKVVARVADGREIVFDTLDEAAGVLQVGAEIEDPVSKFTIKRLGTCRWRLTSPDGLMDELGQVPGDAADDPERWKIARVLRTTGRARDAELRYLYDQSARLVAVRDTAGRLVKLENDVAGRLVRVLLPDPDEPEHWLPAVEFLYSDTGDLVGAHDALGGITRYAYDAHLLVQETDRNGHAFYWIYDGRSTYARCVRTWGDGGIHDSVIDYGDRLSTVTDSFGHTTLYRTNELGAVVEIRDPAGKKKTFEHDGALNVAAETDPLERVTRTAYDSRGRPGIVQTPDGERVVFKHHRSFPELVTLYQNQCGSIWRWRYDRRGRLSSARGPLGDGTTFEWKRGLLMAVTEPGGHRTEHEYDHHGNQIRTTLPNGGKIERTFDRRGRLRTIDAPNGGRTTVTYDLRDRVTSLISPEGGPRTFRYDAEGNLTEASDRRRCLRYTYGGFNQLVACDDAGDIVRYRYDLEGRLVEVTNERGNTYLLEYDLCGRLSREIGFDLQERQYVRDAAGRVIEIKSRSGSTKLRYDAADRVVEQTYPDGKTSVFAYRGDGPLMAAVNDSIAVTFERDELGRVLCEEQGDDRVMSTFGLSGDRLSMQSSGGAYQSILRDPLGNPRSVFLGPLGSSGRQEIAFARDALGLEIERLVPGNIKLQCQRDPAGRPIAQRAQAVLGSWTRKYEWGAGDQLLVIEDSRFGRKTYRHDARGRLFSAEDASGAVQYRSPDEVGNLYRTPDRSDRRYVRGGIVRRAGEAELLFDQAGRLLVRQCQPATVQSGDETWRYEWNGAGMLKEVTAPDGAVVAFSYDALGRRISKKAGASETRYIWDGDLLLHERSDNAPTITWYHTPETFEPLARFDGTHWQHVLVDQVGAPLAVYGASGMPLWEGQIDLYGSLCPPVQTADLYPWRWPGQYHDAETDLVYNRLRYYDPGLGQFISQDPIGLAGGLGLYSYVVDPLVFIDPLGLTSCKAAAVLSPGERLDMGIVKAVVPKSKFDALIASGGISPIRAWSGPYQLPMTTAPSPTAVPAPTRIAPEVRVSRGEQLSGVSHDARPSMATR